MAKILITGAAGFFGYHIAQRLSAKKDNEVILVVRSIPKDTDEEFKILTSRSNIKVIEADLTDASAWKKIGDGYDFVYHLVSIKGFKNFNTMPQEVLRVGIISTLNVLDWFRLENKKEGAKILYTSSNEVYSGGPLTFGVNPDPIPESIPLVIPDPYNPRWSHGGQKLIGELLFIHYSKAFNFRMSIVRPANIYGPRAGFDGMIAKTIQKIMDHTDPFTIFGADDNRIFCYIDDAVDAMIKVNESEKTDGQTYNIAGNSKVSVKEITEIIFDKLDWIPKKIILENPPIDSVINNFPDISKINKVTGWIPKVSLEDGLSQTIEWYKTSLYNQ